MLAEARDARVSNNPTVIIGPIPADQTRDKLIRIDHTIFGMVPSYECFCSDYPVAFCLDLGLEMEYKFIVFKSF